MTAIEASKLSSQLRALGVIATSVLFARILLAILWEYQWYFPPDFDASDFLSGRRYSFVGTYRSAFYAHIVSGPLAVVLGVFLVSTGGRHRWIRVHRFAGRLQMLLVLAVVVPSGLVMAGEAYAGPLAGAGFASLSAATGICALVALLNVRRRNYLAHQRWATRCFILLMSPLLLRLVGGAVLVTGLESEWSYRLNAWLSWIVPLAIYEIWWRRSARRDSNPDTIKSRLTQHAAG